MLPGSLGEVDAAHLDGTVGFRSVAPDRLPLIGQVPDVDEARRHTQALAGVHLPDLPRREGLYCVTGLGSRGLIWSALAGELIASLVEAEPLPLESDLADAIDPGRFVLRRMRAGRL
jgi:tRNA 5-methylaminomethyl-2-thiouridine biosynthesis bifunctional protein